VNACSVSSKLRASILLAFAFSLMPTALIAQQLPSFSGSYNNDSRPISLFIALQKGSLEKWEDVCCMQLGKCRSCVPKPMAIGEMAELNVVRLQGKKNELFICSDPQTEIIFQCPAVFYEKGTLKVPR
jgi:hypothetical protein